VLRRFRGIEEMLQGLSPILNEAYDFVDEYISLTLESHLTQLLEKVNRALGIEATAAPGHQKMRLILERERQHRDNVGYPRILESGVPNEHYVYRRGILKKFVMSVLFLEVKREKETHRVPDTVGAIAAGLAMVFAVAVAVWAERRYGLNTGPFFGALVVSYILKDRIKEWVKRYSSRFLSRFTSDYRLEIMDPRNEESVGVSRETFSFVSSGDIPDDVLSRRHGGAPNSIEARSKREICLKYEKEIILKGKIIDQHHARLLDVNDIMR
ncbi:uncharacterized protein METZ01_LOCUS427953, partial [marine metagenome]